MKIPRYYSPRIGKTELRPSPAARRKASVSRSRKPRKDEISLSPHVAEVQKFTEVAKAMPDVRQEKIDAIKKQIEDGTYKVSAESIAKSIIDLHTGINREDTP